MLGKKAVGSIDDTIFGKHLVPLLLCMSRVKKFLTVFLGIEVDYASDCGDYGAFMSLSIEGLMQENLT